MPDPFVLTVLTDALGHVVADSMIGGTGKLARRAKRISAEEPLAHLLSRALAQAFIDASRDHAHCDEAWVRDVADIWAPAFTPAVVDDFIESLANFGPEARVQFRETALAALEVQGCDIAQLGAVIWVDQFLHVLPQYFWDQLRKGALHEPKLAEFMKLMLAERADARDAIGQRAPSPREYRDDIRVLLGRLADQARNGQIPAYLAGTDVLTLSRQVVVREGVRKSGGERPEDDKAPDDRRAYLLPVDRAGFRLHRDTVPPRPWLEAAAGLHQVVVLSDPGLGKSWLVRTEALRYAEAALKKLDTSASIFTLTIPVPLRCDQLARAAGDTLGQAAADHFARMGWIAQRSRRMLAEQVDAGHAQLLLDAYDELPSSDASRRFGQLLTAWAEPERDRRWVLTSRIAGYAGPPVGATEVELQALSPDDVASFIREWGLPGPAENRLLSMIENPAIAGMARIPLLLSMLCSLAARLPAQQELPSTRHALYSRMLRWYLERPHREPAESVDIPPPETVLEILSKVAYTFAAQQGGWCDLMPKDMLIAAIRASTPAFSELGRSAEKFIEEVSVRTGLLVPEGDISEGREPRYLFMHRTFAEYLTARYVASLSESEWLKIIEEHLWFDPDWAETIPMLAGCLKSQSEARRLLQYIIDQPNDAFYQSFLTAVPILSEREDRERLQAPSEAEGLVNTIVQILQVGIFRESAVVVLASAATLPLSLTRRLIDLLDDDVPEMRIAALRILHGRPVPGLQDQVLRLLGDEEPKVQRAAAELLAGRADLATFQALTARLADEQDPVRAAIVAAVARYPMPDLLSALQPVLTAASATMRAGAVQALGARALSVPLGLFLKALADDSPAVRLSAVEALARRAERAATRGLLNCLADRSQDVREQALKALVPRRVKAEAFIDAYLAQVIDDTPSGRGWRPRPLVVPAMPRRLVDALMTRLSSDNSGIRVRAADALAAARPPRLDQQLISMLTSGDPDLRQAAAQASEGRREPRLLAQLLTSLTDGDAAVRRAALQALIASNAPHLSDRHLLTCLTDPDPEVRWTAAEAAADRQSGSLTDALAERVLNDDQPIVVLHSVRALKGRHGRNVTAALHACLNRSDMAFIDYLFQPAAREMNHRDPDAVLRALRRYLDGDYAYTQRAAAAVLTSCSASGVNEVLIAVLANGTRKGRIAAWWALARRPSPSDLVILVNNIATASGETRTKLLTAAWQLAKRHYLSLPSDDRAQVREILTTCSPHLGNEFKGSADE
jgi:HEAT repeat protein